MKLLELPYFGNPIHFPGQDLGHVEERAADFIIGDGDGKGAL